MTVLLVSASVRFNGLRGEAVTDAASHARQDQSSASELSFDAPLARRHTGVGSVVNGWG
jgi:hypothetical protein